MDDAGESNLLFPLRLFGLSTDFENAENSDRSRLLNEIEKDKKQVMSEAVARLSWNSATAQRPPEGII
jgi:hypothetical protein